MPFQQIAVLTALFSKTYRLHEFMRSTHVEYFYNLSDDMKHDFAFTSSVVYHLLELS